MNKVTEFKVDTFEAFQKLVDKKDFAISKAIVTAILSNLKTRKKLIPVIAVRCLTDNRIYDITVERKDFVDTLKENIQHFQDKEMYEQCAEITKAIEILNSK